jgi:uncharacterized protein YndB with AHSA1/START domain
MTSRSPAPVVVRVTHRFRASAERVFDAWTDPLMASRFLFATGEGTIVECEIDARVGGEWRITDRREDGDVEHRGQYVEIDRPRRLVFTFQVPKYAQWTDRVEIDIVPSDDGGCELALTHTMVPEAAEWADRTVEGWTMILGNLEKALESDAA